MPFVPDTFSSATLFPSTPHIVPTGGLHKLASGLMHRGDLRSAVSARSGDLRRAPVDRPNQPHPHAGLLVAVLDTNHAMRERIDALEAGAGGVLVERVGGGQVWVDGTGETPVAPNTIDVYLTTPCSRETGHGPRV